MGWDYTRGAKKADIVRTLVRETPRGRASEWSNARQETVQLDYDVSARTVAHKVSRNVLWLVREWTFHRADGAEQSSRVIACILLRNQKGFGWGYKGMTEDMGPLYFDCPLAFLDMAPVACPDWRNQVRSWHEQQLPTGR